MKISLPAICMLNSATTEPLIIAVPMLGLESKKPCEKKDILVLNHSSTCASTNPELTDLCDTATRITGSAEMETESSSYTAILMDSVTLDARDNSRGNPESVFQDR